jgi:hypothetical protein
MAPFALFSTLGLFPNPGQNIYFIVPPFSPSVSITNKLTDATATIRDINFDKEYKNIYIQSAKLKRGTYEELDWARVLHTHTHTHTHTRLDAGACAGRYRE